MRSAPYGTSSARDAIDFILTASAYDQEIRVLFIEDGIFQLLSQQKPTQDKQKRIASLISAFEMYDIEHVYFDRVSANERNLEEQQLLDCAKPADQKDIAELINLADTVLSF